MALVGYTIGDASTGYDIFRFSLTSNTVTNVGSVAPSSVGNEDLEGLGTDNSGNVVAVSESNFGNSGFRVSSVNAPNPPLSTSVLGGTRFGTEAGADFDGNTLYNLQGNDTAADGAIGSILYKVNSSGNAVKVGTGNPVNSEYADGLAIEGTGTAKLAVASDFSTNDGDNNELYKVNLTNGTLGTPIPIALSGGGLTGSVLNQDSGLAFSPDGKTLFALIEDGNLFKATKTDINNGGNVTFQFVRKYNLPAGADYEGLAIADEPSGSLTGSTGAVNASAARFDVGAEAQALSIEDLSVAYGSSSSEVTTDEVDVAPIATGDSSWLDTINDIV